MRRLASPSLLALALAGCTVGPDYERPAIALTPAYVAEPSAAPDAVLLARWWDAFDDPLLSRIVTIVLSENLDLEHAAARVMQARAAADAAGAALLPQGEATGSAGITDQSRATPVGRISQAFGGARSYESYSAGVEASWEIDLFGGLQRRREAARASLEAAQADAQAVRIAMTAEAADAYIGLRAFQARLAVAAGQEKLQADLVDLLDQRVRQGITADRALRQASALLQGTRATMPPLRAGIAAQMNRLDVLMGAQPGASRGWLAAEAPIPAPPGIATGAPNDLLRRRPDVIAAERRLAAAHAGIGAAIADYYPKFSLGGLLGFAGTAAGDLFTGPGFNAAGMAGMRWRLFDFGRVDAEVAGARGRTAEALAAWRLSVLGAAEDVETSLAALAQDRARTGFLQAQLAELATSRTQSRQAYDAGVVSLIEVIDAERDTLTVSDQLAQSRAATARSAVATFRALGGGWDG